LLKKKHLINADGVAVFVLGAVFLFLSIGLVLLGSSVYRKVVAGSQANDNMRTTLSYIANQVRRNDAQGNIQVGEFYGQDALLLTQYLEGIECVTYLYCWEGSLRELFVEKGYELTPESGLPLIPLEDIYFSVSEEGLISVEALLSGGARGRLLLAPRSGLAGGEGL
jgi:hypothetical protein